MRGHRRRLVAVAAGLVALAVTLGFARAPARDADDPRELMRRVLRNARAEDEITGARIDLVDAGGRVRSRTTTMYAKKRGAEASSRLLRFHTPPDLARSAILTIEQPDRDADQWIYLPAYHAARRVSSASRGNTWMGTDFTYEDLTDARLDQYAYTLLRHEGLDGVRCAVIAAAPTDPKLREESAYGGKIFWIDAEESVAVRIEFHDRGERLVKVLTNAGLRRHGTYRRWDVTRMRDVTRNHETVLTVTDRKIDRGLSDEYFTLSYLERGR